MAKSNSGGPAEPARMAEHYEHVGYRLRKAQVAVFAHFNAAASELGLRPAQFALLDVIRANPGILQTRAAELLGIQKANLVGFVDALEGRGLVARVPVDRRSNGLKLTSRGSGLLRRARRIVDAHDAVVTKGLSAAERRSLVDMLDRIAVNAERVPADERSGHLRSA